MAATKIDLGNGEQVQGALPLANGGTGATSQSGAQSALALVPGTNVQAHSSNLDTWATKTPPSGALVGTTDSQALTNKDLSGAGNVFPSSLATTSQVAPSVYTTTIGNGTTTTFTINHNLGTRNVTVTVYDASTNEVVRPDVFLTDTNNVTLTFGTAPSTGAYNVVVLGGALLANPTTFTQTIGNGSATSFTITHNLGTRSLSVTTYNATTFARVWCDVAFTTTNTATLTFGTAPSTNGVVVVIQGGITLSSAIASTGITDATTIGRNLLTASSASAALSLLTPLQNAQAAYVATSEATSSATYTDLATVTDTVTVTVGPSGMVAVFVSAAITTSTSGGAGLMSYAMSGANTVSALDSKSISIWAQVTSSPQQRLSGAFLETGLSPGLTVFKAKYRGQVYGPTFADRRIAVIPL